MCFLYIILYNNGDKICLKTPMYIDILFQISN